VVRLLEDETRRVSWLELALAVIQAIAAGAGAYNAYVARQSGADAAKVAADAERAREEAAAAAERQAAAASHAQDPSDKAFDPDFKRSGA